MKIVIFAVISFLTFSLNDGYASGKKKKVKSDLEGDGFYGKIKTMTEYDYDAKDNGKEPEKGHMTRKIVISYNKIGYATELDLFDENGKPESKSLYLYDAKGHKIEIDYYDENGKFSYNNKSTFDKDGNEVQWISKKKDSSILESEIKTYDANGNKITSKSFNNDGSLSNKSAFQYDENGNQVEEDWYNDSDKVFKRIISKYDKAGNKIEESELVYNKAQSKITISYNQKGDILEETHFKGDGSLNYKYIYKYDEKGNRIDFAINETNGTNTNITVVKYESFDKTRNYLKSTTFENGKAKEMTEREIVYY